MDNPCNEKSCPSWFTVKGEFLYWNADEPGLNFAITDGVFNTVVGAMTSPDGKVIAIDNAWGPGVRVRVGDILPFDQWNLEAIWTYFSPSGKKAAPSLPLTVPSPEAYITQAQFNSNYGPEGVYASRAKWRLRVNVFDLQLKREFSTANCFCFNPLIGIKLASLQQHFNSTYDTPATTPLGLFSHNKVTFQGIGPESGMETRWLLNSHLSLYGNFSGALLFGSYRLHSNGYFSNLDGTAPKVGKNYFSDHYELDRMTYQFAIGIQWDESFWCDRIRCGLNLGWEQTAWFGFNQLEGNLNGINTLYLEHKNETLVYQGLVVGANIEF